MSGTHNPQDKDDLLSLVSDHPSASQPRNTTEDSATTDPTAGLQSLVESLDNGTDIQQLLHDMDVTDLVFDGIEKQLEALMGNLGDVMKDLESIQQSTSPGSVEKPPEAVESTPNELQPSRSSTPTHNPSSSLPRTPSEPSESARTPVDASPSGGLSTAES